MMGSPTVPLTISSFTNLNMPWNLKQNPNPIFKSFPLAKLYSLTASSKVAAESKILEELNYKLHSQEYKNMLKNVWSLDAAKQTYHQAEASINLIIGEYLKRFQIKKKDY